MDRRSERHRSQAGSAFVISILVLFILSVLGMALMLSTTTETAISTNYRWGEMAFFNADAGLEYGKSVLAAYMLRDGDLRAVLPAPRAADEMDEKPLPPPGEADCPDPTTAGCRDYQYSLVQDPTASPPIRLFIGRVLREPNGRLLQYDFRQPGQPGTRDDLDGDGVNDVQGTVTVWVRRPIVGGRDSPDNDRVVLTAEGTAPNASVTGSDRSGALRRLEMAVRLVTEATALSQNTYSDEPRAGDTGTEATAGSTTAPAGNVVGVLN